MWIDPYVDRKKAEVARKKADADRAARDVAIANARRLVAAANNNPLSTSEHRKSLQDLLEKAEHIQLAALVKNMQA